MYRLVIEDDEGHTTPVSLIRDEFSIGRREGNSIRLTQRNVSRRHARVFRENNLFFVEDLGSFNGVRLNGERIAGKRALREGDIVQIGDYHLMIQRERAGLAKGSEGAANDSIPTTHPGPVRAHVKTAPMYETAPQPTVSPVAVAAAPLPAAVGAMPAAPQVPSSGEAHPGASTEVAKVSAHPLPARFAVLTPALGVREISVTESGTTIGTEGTVVLGHRSLAKQHARVVLDDSGVAVHDLGGGLRVNGESYPSRVLRDGDLVELSGVKLRFTGRAATAAPQDPAEVQPVVIALPDLPAHRDALDADLALLGTTQPAGAPEANAAVAGSPRSDVDFADEPAPRRRPVFVALLAAGAVALGAVLYFALRSPPPSSRPTDAATSASASAVPPRPTAPAPIPTPPRPRASPQREMGSLPAETLPARAAFPESPPAVIPPRDLGAESRERAAVEALAGDRRAPRAAERAPAPEEPERPVATAPPAPAESPSPPDTEAEPEDPPSPAPSARTVAPREPELEPAPEPRKPAPPPPDVASPLEHAKALVAEGTTILLRSPPQAIGILRRALALAPRLPDVHKQLGIAYNATGNDVAAVRHLKRYLALRPSAPDAAEIRNLIADTEQKAPSP